MRKDYIIINLRYFFFLRKTDRKLSCNIGCKLHAGMESVRRRFHRSYNVPATLVEINFSAAAEMWFELSFSSGRSNAVSIHFVGIYETLCESKLLEIYRTFCKKNCAPIVLKLSSKIRAVVKHRCGKYWVLCFILSSISFSLNSFSLNA